MKPVSLIFLLWYGGLFCDQSQAQTIFLDHGKILFEKRVNMYSFLQTDDAGTFENYNTQYRKDKPQFATSLFFLSFKNERLLYKRARESKEPGNTLFWKYFDADNIVYSDLANQKKTTQKNVFEEKFLLADSISNIKWKITNETREIAGFLCRRANALIMDSIFIVAFYTPAITCSGGPEGVGGLPGMILGFAIPSQHLTWFATKIFRETDEEIVPPSMGKKVNRKDFAETVSNVLKDKTKSWKETKVFIEF